MKNEDSESDVAKPVRKRDAAATRQAILDSARREFARSGYAGAGVREIAAGAGATAMLVNRYFGSKEELFSEAVAASMKEPTILAPANLVSDHFVDVFAQTLVEITGKDRDMLEGFAMMLRSASNDRAAAIARDQIEAGHLNTLAQVIGGPDAGVRAGVVLALVAGVQMMRQMIGLSALAEADPELLADILKPVLHELLKKGPG